MPQGLYIILTIHYIFFGILKSITSKTTRSTTQKAKQINREHQTFKFKIESSLESAKGSPGSFKNIPHAPQLPSRVPVGQLETG